MVVRRFGADTLVVRDEDNPEDTRLVDYTEGAVYGMELALPESDDDRYRVDLVRASRQTQGVEVEHRLTLDEYTSQMEAEERLKEVSDALYEQGREAIAEHLPALQNQPPDYTSGYMVASYPPNALFTGESASVSLIALNERGINDAMIGWNMPPSEASHLSMTLEEAQAAGGVPLLLTTATQEALGRGQLEAGQPLFTTSPNSPTFYLDQREVLERDVEIVQPERTDLGWGWHEARFAVLPTESEQTYQTALLDVYRDALTGDLAGSYLPLGEHVDLSMAQAQRDQLEAAAFDAHDSSADWRKFAEKQVEAPEWQPMQHEHYDLYERLAGQEQTHDLPTTPELDPILDEALRLGATIIDLDRKEQGMANTFKAERLDWEVDLNEHVTYLPPHVSAEYRSPANAVGAAPLRLRPQGDESMYGLEVSAPNENGDVTLAATKTFESNILQKDVTESAVLKTYRARDYDESLSYLDPRSEALGDARALVYEWGRHDLDHVMGTALKLAQEDGFKGDSLFEHGPADTFTIPEDARSIATIQAEREWERDAELFGAGGYKLPLPEGVVHAREIGRYGANSEVPPGQFYGVIVREARLGSEEEVPAIYVVEGVKAWLDRETGGAELEAVTLDLRGFREAALDVANGIAAEPDFHTRIARMTELAETDAERHSSMSMPVLGQSPAELLNLTLREEGLFTQGPPDPISPTPASPSLVPNSLDYSRTIGEAAYDLPLEEGQAYEFRMRRLPELETEVARYGVDALAVETVKHWNEDDQPQQEAVTLGIHYDRDEARHEVDTYVDLAEREGIQAAMSRAAVLSDVQNYPNIVERADELGIHPNENVRFGDMFGRGPEDPFLSEREINHAAQQYAADHPAQHELSLEVVPVYDATGQSLGHSVVALDVQWDHEDTSHDYEDAQAVTAYEVAQFERKPDATFYATSLKDYLDKRGLETQGTDISASLDFVKGVQDANGLGENEHWLAPWDVAQLGKGEWSLEHRAEEFHPLQTIPEQAMTVELEL